MTIDATPRAPRAWALPAAGVIAGVLGGLLYDPSPLAKLTTLPTLYLPLWSWHGAALGAGLGVLTCWLALRAGTAGGSARRACLMFAVAVVLLTLSGWMWTAELWLDSPGNFGASFFCGDVLAVTFDGRTGRGLSGSDWNACVKAARPRGVVAAISAGGALALAGAAFARLQRGTTR